MAILFVVDFIAGPLSKGRDLYRQRERRLQRPHWRPSWLGLEQQTAATAIGAGLHIPPQDTGTSVRLVGRAVR